MKFLDGCAGCKWLQRPAWSIAIYEQVFLKPPPCQAFAPRPAPLSVEWDAGQQVSLSRSLIRGICRAIPCIKQPLFSLQSNSGVENSMPRWGSESELFLNYLLLKEKPKAYPDMCHDSGEHESFNCDLGRGAHVQKPLLLLQVYLWFTHWPWEKKEVSHFGSSIVKWKIIVLISLVGVLWG